MDLIVAELHVDGLRVPGWRNPLTFLLPFSVQRKEKECLPAWPHITLFHFAATEREWKLAISWVPLMVHHWVECQLVPSHIALFCLFVDGWRWKSNILLSPADTVGGIRAVFPLIVDCNRGYYQKGFLFCWTTSPIPSPLAKRSRLFLVLFWSVTLGISGLQSSLTPHLEYRSLPFRFLYPLHF